MPDLFTLIIRLVNLIAFVTTIIVVAGEVVK